MQPIFKAVHYKLIFLILAIADTLFLFYYEWQGDKDYKEGLAFSLMFVFLFAIFMLLMEKNQLRLFRQNSRVCYLYIGIFTSIILVSVSRIYPIQHLWMLGCLILAAAYNVYIGVMGTALFLCLDGISSGFTPEQFVFYGVLGIILSQLISFFPGERKVFKLIQTFVYYLIIAESCHITLFLVTNALDYTKLNNIDTVKGMVYTGIIVVVIFFLLLVVRKKEELHQDIPEVIDAAIDAVAVLDEQDDGADIDSMYSDGKADVIQTVNTGTGHENKGRASLTELLDKNHALLVRFGIEYPSIYKHCLRVCRISRSAAQSIGADSELAAAGGMYHEIGKMSGKDDYIDNNLRYAEEYLFPDELKAIMIEHNIKSEIPHSKESAIVYFTDSILSTINYLISVKKITNVPAKSIVESFFAKRLEDANLDESGLTIKDFKVLKEYYIDYFKEES